MVEKDAKGDLKGGPGERQEGKEQMVGKGGKGDL